MGFMEAFDLWLDTAPLRGATVLFRHVSDLDGEADIPVNKAAVKPAASPSLPLSSPSETLSVRELCAYLDISRATLYRYDIPGKCKIGGKVQYVKAEVDAYLAKGRSLVRCGF